MTDPLDALRTPVTPVDPDPAFAARLRARLERALALPRGVLVSDTTTTRTPADVQQSADAHQYRHGDVGYAWLSVPDVDRAATFYEAVLGWTAVPGSDSQGRQVAGRSPHLGLHGGEPHSTLNCCYAVEDIAAAMATVRTAGGQAGEPRDTPYGRLSDCRDDQGTVFSIYQPPHGIGTEAPVAGRHGDLVYVSFEVVDSSHARAFYGLVLGWEFTPGGLPDSWQVAGGTAGLRGGHPRATTLPMWQVDDIGSAVERVRAAGGSATDPVTRPYGGEAECTDDQGTRFYLGQL